MKVFRTSELLSQKKERIHIILLGILSVSVATLFVFFRGFSEWNFGDAFDYLSAGFSIANGEPYPRQGSLPFFRPPGYPALIALLSFISESKIVIILKIFNIGLHASTTLIIYSLTCKKINSKSGFFAAIFYALNPFSLHQATSISTETLTAFLFVSFAYLMTFQLGVLKSILLGCVMLFLISVRPEYLFVVIPIYVFLSCSKKFLKGNRITAAVILIVIFTSLSVWGVSNQKATGKFILLTDAANYHLWLGSLDIAVQNYTISFSKERDFNQNQWNSLTSRIDKQKRSWGDRYEQASIGDRSDLWWSAFRSSVQEQGVFNYIKLLLLKGLIFWRPYLNPPSYDVFSVLLSLPILIFLTLVFIFGIKNFFRKGTLIIPVWIYCFGLLVITGVHMLQWPDLRYRIPLFLPICAIMLGGLVDKRVKSKKNTSVGPGGG